jgi:CHAT domain-containing protein
VPADAAPPGPRLGRLAAAQVRYGVVRRRLLAENPAFRRWEEPAPVSAADLADLARRSRGTLYLEWAVLDEKTTLLFALGDDGKGLTARALRLPVGAGALGRLTRGWRRALVGNNVAVAQTERQFARDLFDALLGPAERAGLLAPGRFNRLVLVPDGPLLDIPFAALEDRAGRRLVERFPLSRAISLGALCLPDLPEPAGKSAAGLDLFCAASPASPAQVASAGGRVRGSGGAATPPLRFRPLRHAAEEAKGISALFPGALTLTGGAMTESALRREMGRHAVLHFVTHGVLDPANGLGSWLLLSPEAGADPEHDGRLEAREIMGMSLSARMAVLSSCASGRGQDQGGDGVLGFAWAFRAAGCPSVVSSLWEIDDRATARLMAAFYARLRAGAAKDEALRGAMLTLRREDRTRRPFFWAAFDITGDAGPIITKKASPGR